MDRRAGSSGVVRACIQLAAWSRSRLLHNLTYTFITDIGPFMIRLSYNTIGLSKPSDRSLCSLSSLLRCSEVFASKQTNSVLRSLCRFMQTILPRVHSETDQHERSFCTRVVIGLLHAAHAGEIPVPPPPFPPWKPLIGPARLRNIFLHSIPPLLISRRSVGSVLSSENSSLLMHRTMPPDPGPTRPHNANHASHPDVPPSRNYAGAAIID